MRLTLQSASATLTLMIFEAEQVAMWAGSLREEVNPCGVRDFQPTDVAASGLPRNAELTDLTIRPMKPFPPA